MEDILPKPPPPPSAPTGMTASMKKSRKPKVSWVAVVFVILLTLVLVILGECFMTDLNQWLNPAYDTYGGSYRRVSPVYDEAVLARHYDQADYELYRLAIHTAFAIPLLLAGFLFYFWFMYKRSDHPNKIIVWPYFLLTLWVMLHVILEAFYFLIEQYEKLGIYIVLILLVVVLTWLAMFVQKKWHQKHGIT
ncbi:MAG: hypothetical protein A2898_00350 [Candidatus Kerfeldbacteria bacterium RIFCSPLOWO2_01_FULL_48_11]|uniref:Uncharacterized protein n=1 Tax=Candidatus Kerfeldbacteria bacterium RIFCSPLOWO2_01_FULL_48_11 TaxID=1798543 RepID=A0A1G2B5I4_9BACT|nr:MAG: hypothetical protein UY34_C0002G0010 [Parcubacteria group bacterium GW2011_GWA2_48_9]OGY84402.1 MAG: hypothetical protein A2898_00350 [Candidatus Kerfeldbacteria bacterium RIFCSPLOWO2_01_FULL_48_11]HCJ52223.1 hypothetical protein [Candidatus Kerfeldbacteria bacterium]HCM67397.1 hypothetical protein [Candidatus Kerfeldbacteria bacterium]